MARREILIDDITGGHDDVQPVSFTLNGSTYSLDLGVESREALMTALQPYIDHARGAKRKRATRAPGEAKVPGEVAELRRWARENGYSLGDRGRIPENIREAYANR